MNLILDYDKIVEENLSERLDGQYIMDLLSVNVNSRRDYMISMTSRIEIFHSL